MEFALSDEQKMLEESLRSLFAKRITLDRLRPIAESGLGFDSALWNTLVEQGVPGLLVPERFGGVGLTLLDAATAAESLAYHAVPAPFAGSLVMAPLALMLSANAAQQARWLPEIARGAARFGVAFAAGSGQTGEAFAELDGDRLSGRITGALDCGGATHYLLYLADGQAVLVDAAQAGVDAQVHRSLDRTRPVADLSFDHAAASLLNSAPDPQAAASRVLDAGRVMLAADTLGAAQSMFDKALAYSKERVQFNRVIGSFQGVKHTLADMITALEPCRSLVWFAAYAQDALPDEARVAALQAKAHLGDVGHELARLATEVHGGMGFTDLLGLHYWFKRIAFNRQLLGGPEHCRQEAAAVQGWLAAPLNEHAASE